MVRAFVLKRSETGGGGVGFRGDDLIGEDHSFDALSHPLEGFSFATADGIIQVVVAVYAATPQQVRFDNELLEFQVNGNPREQRFTSGGTVWFDPTERDDCALASP